MVLVGIYREFFEFLSTIDAVMRSRETEFVVAGTLISHSDEFWPSVHNLRDNQLKFGNFPEFLLC